MTELTSSSEFENKIRLLQKKKKRNLIVKIISASLTFILILAYFILPISRVSNSVINGNVNYTHDQILSIAGIDKKDSLYLISKDDIEKKLIDSPLIKDDSVKVRLSPGGLKIELEEIVPILKYENGIYMSDGNVLDDSIRQSKDPLVSDYLFTHTQNLVQLYSKPFEEKFTSSRVSHLSKLVLKLSEDELSKIAGISYDSTNYYYNFYFNTGLEDGTLLKIVFDSAKSVDTLIEIIRQEKVDQYIGLLSDKKTKENFVLFTERLNGEEKNIKSIKIIMQTIEEKVYYHVKYNNPVSSNEEN